VFLLEAPRRGVRLCSLWKTFVFSNDLVRNRFLFLAVFAELFPRTFCTFPREFSSLRRPRAAIGQRQCPGQVLRVSSCDVRSPVSPGSSPDARARGSRWSEGGQLSVIRRPRRLIDTFRRPPIGWPPRGPGGRRPRVPSGLLAPRPLCRNTSRQASGRETVGRAEPSIRTSEDAQLVA
jgi:hypothetical protein